MLLLSLVRHAKSAYPPGIDDHDRPLNERGRRDAPHIGAVLAEGPPVNLALVSTATRAQSTWQLAAEHLPGVPMLTSAQLYLASPAQIVAQVQRLTDASVPPPQHVVVVAHNPGLEELASWLVQPQPRADYEAMATKFPTSAVAQITVTADDWRQMSVGSGSAQLRSFTIARG